MIMSVTSFLIYPFSSPICWVGCERVDNEVGKGARKRAHKVAKDQLTSSHEELEPTPEAGLEFAAHSPHEW